MATMREKAQEDTGNNFHIICNGKFWDDINLVLGEYLANFKTDGCYMYSKDANKKTGGYVKVGATFNAYNFAGNTVIFTVDRTLTREYGTEKGFAMCLDLTADKTSNTPAIAKFSLTGRDFITNKILGVNYIPLGAA